MDTEAVAQFSIADFGTEVRSGLTQSGQKELPSKYLYDEVGSALFEVITALPEYGLCRADERLLQKYAEEIVRPLLPAPIVVAELGSGSGKKTRWILQALARRQRTRYYPIEISPTALAQCAKELGQMDWVSIVGFERPYLDGLLSVAVGRRPGERLLVLFLGSTIGNFDRPAGEQFLAEVRRRLKPGDALLLGADLEKPLPQILSAYDDPLGVTAAFDLARYDHTQRRVEMHLQSLRRQDVAIPGAGCVAHFQEGETIWTESSHKYQAAEVTQMGQRNGFRTEAQWVDQEWPFAQTLLIAE
jgi:uncharacterized SAM-dependent methyltransferase